MPDYNKLSPNERRILREQYVIEQGGNCYFCKASLAEKPPKNITKMKINWKLFPPKFLRYPIHLHHCHKTGNTLGAVHSYCNAVLWQYYEE